ncbi:hypothetical protein ACVWW1_007347 [Bradyrhizobium sp. JR3.5]
MRSSFSRATIRADSVDAEPGHRLVQQQELRLGGKRDRELELALLAMAQLRHHDIGALAEADTLQCRAGGGAQMPLLARIAPKAERVAVMRLRRERDVVDRGKILQQRGDLERARQPEPAALVGRQARDVAAGKPDGSGIRHHLPGELADQRGLPGAVGADDGVQFARQNLHREIVGRGDAAEAAHQIVDAEQGISQGIRHGSSSRAGP